MRRLLIAAFLLFTSPAIAADPIPAAEAAQHVGETATVVGVLSNVHTDAKKYIFLDIGGVHPDNVFTGVIFGKTLHNPPDFTPLVGKALAITGTIRMYHGKPEIVIDSAAQIAVAHPTAP